MAKASNLAPNATSAFPDDILLYEPSGSLHVVEIPMSDGRVHRTFSGTALTTGDDASGPSAGTVPQNEYNTGTENYIVGVRHIGPPMQAVDQIAPFVNVGSGMVLMNTHQSLAHGVTISNVRPVLHGQRVGVFFDVGLVAFGEIRSIQFHITYTGIPTDPSWDPPERAQAQIGEGDDG